LFAVTLGYTITTTTTTTSFLDSVAAGTTPIGSTSCKTIYLYRFSLTYISSFRDLLPPSVHLAITFLGFKSWVGVHDS
jgi:hypothetical protein